MNHTVDRMTKGRKEAISNSLSEFDILVLDWYISIGNETATIWDVCQAIGVPQFVSGDVIRRLVGLGLLTTVYNNKPVHTRLATATEKGRLISTFYNSDEFLDG